MNIKAEKWIVDGDAVYKVLEVKKCCDRIINSENISLNSNYYDNEDYDNNKNYSIKLIRKEHSFEDYTECYYETINFCPFCGQPIMVEIVNEVDKIEEYKLLKENRDVLWKKCQNTDSKKKENELREQVRDLDKKINSMLTSDDLG